MSGPGWSELQAVPGVLGRIAQRVRERVEAEKADSLASAGLQRELESPGRRRPRDFLPAFGPAGVARDRPAVIAEVKLASPSEGNIAAGADPVAVAGAYLGAGARALSVLTEPDFFKGSPAYLRAIRARYPDALLLMKDFVIDDHQLERAVVDGADAVLLIVALLGRAGTRSFLLRALGLGLTPLVEVHDRDELEIAAACGARLIGVNNRNLKTMEVTLETSLRLAPLAPEGAVLISESGIRTAEDIARLARAGYRGFLVGTGLMKTGDPGGALTRLMASPSSHSGKGRPDA